MALSKDDKEWVKLTTRELVFEVSKEVLASHVTKCPYGQKIVKVKTLLIGVVIGGGLFGMGSEAFPLLLKILARLWG